MNIAIILASGNSNRMNQIIPKQYMKINNKTILEHCFLKFYNNSNVDLILLVIKKEFLNKVIKIFAKYNKDKIDFCFGGKSRNESILFAINYLEKKNKLSEKDIIITHDANRIFIDEKTINENIKLCKKYGCVLTGKKAIDTTYFYKKDKIKNIIDRETLFNAETPQTFSFNKIKKIIKNNKIKNFHETDLGTIAFLNNEQIYIFKNKNLNFKITYLNDFELAKKILEK